MKLDYLHTDMDLGNNEERKLVGFSVDDVCYGLDIMDVREVINPSPLIKVPTLPRFVLGVVDHREDIVPVIDVKRRFQLAATPATKRTKWIILRVRHRLVGLEVDRVIQVVTVNRSMKKEKVNITDGDKPWIRSVYRTPEFLLFELDTEVVVDVENLDLDPEAVRKSIL